MKKLAGETAIYGLSSIVGRFLNYLLVPLYVSQFDPGVYGVVTELYAWVGFLIVALTYGMETAFFRFFNKEKDNPKVYSTALSSIVFSSFIFMGVFLFLAQPIADAMQYSGNVEYIMWFTLILSFDAITAIPFAKLRADHKPTYFAVVKLVNIGLNIGINLFFVYYCKEAHDNHTGTWAASLYDPSIGVGYVFIANLVASGVTLLMLLPQMRQITNGFDSNLWKRMLAYSWPLILVGMAGIINEMLDRTLLKYLLPGTTDENLYQLGIYGACYKLAMLMSLFIQAFRYASEPFFFAQADQAGSKQLYAKVLNYFTIFGCGVFLVITLFIDFFKYFIPNEEYHIGLHVVPILLMANLFLGLYVNLSIWYKLTDKTKLGAWVAAAGAAVTIALNVAFIPTYGYTASAWATLASYATLTLLSYWLGRKYYPVPYQLRKVLFYIVLALGVYWLGTSLPFEAVAKYSINMVMIAAYTWVVWMLERPQTRAK